MTMMDEHLADAVQLWMADLLGVRFESFGLDEVAVLERPEGSAGLPFWAVQCGRRSVVVCRPEWIQQLGPIVESLGPEQLFSTFGTYEIATVTLPDGVGIWGPSWYLFTDTADRKSGENRSVSMLCAGDLDGVDPEIFWHSVFDGAVCHFGVREAGRIVALAGVKDVGDPVLEIGLDVARDAQGSGLGKAVVSAAIEWIVDKQGKIACATTAPFNVPSVRTLRAAGLRFGFSALLATPDRFILPPQPLGLPYPEAQIYNYYPEWAMNPDIKPS
jgi:GNAT superfamily N-acetyltransferase